MKNKQKKALNKKFTKLKVGDEIIVLAGKDKGNKGKISRLFSKTNKALVTGVNLVTKHMKPNPQKGIAGGLVKKESGIALSNIAIFNPETEKADRISYKIEEDGSKIRVFTSSQAPIDN